jgi:fucose 4-O-acetylase-like acetyltransferase
MIVFSHSEPPFLEIFGSIASYTAMSLFFFISGYLFNYDKYRNSFNIFVKKRIKRLVLPFFVTYFLAIIVSYIVRAFALGYAVETSLSDMIMAMFYGNATQNNPAFLDAPLWFLLCLFCGNIILYIYLMYMENRNEYMGIIFSLIIAIIGYFIGKYFFLFWSLDVALVSLVFMYLGFLAKKHSIFYRLGDKFEIYAFVFSTPLFFFLISINYPIDINHRIYGNFILFILGSFLGIGLSVIAAKRIKGYSIFKDLLAFFGINSMIILVFHKFWIGYIKDAIRIFEPKYYFIFNNWFVIFSLMIAISLVTIYILKKVKLLEEIYNND